MNFSGKKIAPNDAQANKHPLVGSRVHVFMSITGDEVMSLGEGTLVSLKEGPPWDPQCNCPRIDLDQGGSVWGHECYWGPAGASFDAKFKDKKIVPHAITRSETGQIIDVSPIHYEFAKHSSGATLQ